MVKIIGSPLILESSIAHEACASMAVDYSTYREDPVGEANEAYMFKVAYGLDCKSYLSPKGSHMDCGIKGDLVLEVGKYSLIWQVKSSQIGADSFLSKRSTFKGESYPLPGVLVPDDQHLVTSVFALAKVCGIAAKPSLTKAVALYKEHRGKKVPLGKIPSVDKIFSKEVCNMITAFNLGEIRYGSTLILY